MMLILLKCNNYEYSVRRQINFGSGESTILCIGASSHTGNPIISVWQGSDINQK